MHHRDTFLVMPLTAAAAAADDDDDK